MTQPDPGSALVLAEFHDRLWSDRMAGREFGLDDYVEQFPLHQDLIIAE